MNSLELLRRLTTIKLTSEDDVREEFVTPLLHILGYDHSRGEIKRAKSVSVPYQSGTKRKEYIVPDYIVSAGDRNHFVVDANTTTRLHITTRLHVLLRDFAFAPS